MKFVKDIWLGTSYAAIYVYPDNVEHVVMFHLQGIHQQDGEHAAMSLAEAEEIADRELKKYAGHAQITPFTMYNAERGTNLVAVTI